MSSSGIFLSIKDLASLEGYGYKAAQKHHQALRDVMQKKRITILDYCKYEELDFDYVWKFLRCRSDRL